MGRPETHVDPSEGPRQRFAYELRALRRSAGNPPCREPADRAEYSGTTLSKAARGLGFPSFAVTLAPGPVGVAGAAGVAGLSGHKPKTAMLSMVAGTCTASGFWLGRSLQNA
ncbi:hypothetical protein GCM10017688_64160 [Streptomyces ramulosus]